MNPREDDPLLQEILNDESLVEARRASLQAGLRTVRMAKRAQIIRRAGGVILTAALLAVALTWQRPIPPAPESASQSGSGSNPSRTADGQPVDTTVKLLTDEELFALFPGRSVMLVGRPGHQELVFLDASESKEH